MGLIRSITHPGEARRRLAIFGAIALVFLVAQLLIVTPAQAVPLTGTFGPTIVDNLADLNGDGVADGVDDANAFYGDTHIIDGALDCDAWSGPNGGEGGSGVIDADDDCTLIGYDGTADGVTITVTDGSFQVADGPLPHVFNAADPDNPDIGDSDFAWSARDGRVDSNGNEVIGAFDCHIGLIGLDDDLGLGDPTDGVSILGASEANPNPCGFANAPADNSDGLVDLNEDQVITVADSCTGCFFGLDVASGFVQETVPPECPGHAGDPRNDVIGTAAGETLTGTPGDDIICGRGGDDVLRGLAGDDLLLGGAGNDVALGNAGADTIRGGRGADVLRGGRGPDDLFGGRGRDELYGGRGRDFLNGGRGSDLGRGGPGVDTLRSIER